jgi:hypothetical protein
MKIIALFTCWLIVSEGFISPSRIVKLHIGNGNMVKPFPPNTHQSRRIMNFRGSSFKGTGVLLNAKLGIVNEKKEFTGLAKELVKEHNDEESGSGNKITAIRKMFSYIWPKNDLKTRLYLILSLNFLFFGKLLNAQVPFILQKAVDGGNTLESLSSSNSHLSTTALMFLLYAGCRITAVGLNELKTSAFAKVSQRALRLFSGEIFSHLHILDSTFHHKVKPLF